MSEWNRRKYCAVIKSDWQRRSFTLASIRTKHSSEISLLIDSEAVEHCMQQKWQMSVTNTAANGCHKLNYDRMLTHQQWLQWMYVLNATSSRLDSTKVNNNELCQNGQWLPWLLHTLLVMKNTVSANLIAMSAFPIRRAEYTSSCKTRSCTDIHPLLLAPVNTKTVLWFNRLQQMPTATAGLDVTLEISSGKQSVAGDMSSSSKLHWQALHDINTTNMLQSL